MEGRERGIVYLGNESGGRRGQQRTAETKETYGALTWSLLYFLALKYLCGLVVPLWPFQTFQYKQQILHKECYGFELVIAD